MSPKRWNVCIACEGTRKGETGDVCYECQGLGGSWYGEDRTLEAIEADIVETTRIMEADREEVFWARASLAMCKPEREGGLSKQVEHLREALAYWKAQLDGLEVEREAALLRDRPARRSVDGDNSSTRVS